MPRVVEENRSKEFMSVKALIGYVNKVARRINNSKMIVEPIRKQTNRQLPDKV